MENTPLISCIMPTANRCQFVPHAIGSFLRQDYVNKELLIVDDGTDCIEDIVPIHEQIRYIRVTAALSLGEKRNFCVRESRGDLIMHWDDDDWMAPHRISYQVKELLLHNAEVCGLQKMIFRELQSGKCWLYTYPPHAQPWIAGGSLLYTRSFWSQSPFPDVQVVFDTRFIYARKLTSFVVLEHYDFYVASIHHNNTSFKDTTGTLWKGLDKAVVKNIMGDEWELYATAERESAPTLHAKPVISGANTKTQKVSACLLSFKRPYNLQKITDSLHSHAFIDEILVWNNNINVTLALKGEKVRVINAGENNICYSRFLCAREARNEIIYFQDDDALIGNVPELFNAFLNDTSRITYGLSKGHHAIREKYIYPDTQISFLGWGSFIQKEWIKVLDDYLALHPADYIFLREADKFFTLLLQKQNNAIPGHIQLMEGDSTPGIALYLERQHAMYVALAIRQSLAFNRHIKNILPVTWNIVISCMNYGRYLEEAVNSVLYNHADYVITVVDDCSTDNTQQICEKLTAAYPFIKYLRNDRRMGAGYSRNRGVAAVDSIFVVLLDADDKIGSEYLFEAEKLLRKGCDVVNPDAIVFGNVQSRWPVPQTVSLAMQLNRNHVHCCSAFRKSYWAQVGGIDDSMLCWEDYEFWIRLAQAGARIEKINGDHFYYRKHGPSRSGVSINEKNDWSYIQTKHKALFDQYRQR